MQHKIVVEQNSRFAVEVDKKKQMPKVQVKIRLENQP